MQILEQMPAIRDLSGLRGSELDAPLKLRRAIAGDRLNGGMTFQPSGQRLRRAVSQQFHRAMVFEVHNQCAIGATAFPRPIIDANHAED